ncbi:YdjC-like family protein [Listeria fleischmannii FSL S10-1203]|uniref:YdjC-like family protein n=1 Tax=Listeria fleischmannii FSL S10-1203 TaxID=1265822 RepID=W7DR13_9LIST|nr:YdjC-like family protein [Listeria fleischmannii FSL S10-1203]
MLDLAQDEIAEMHFDVGYLDQFVLDNSSYTLLRCKELETICSPLVKKWFTNNQIELITFADLKE